MAYILYCRDAGFDCNAMVAGQSAQEILTQVHVHAAAEHAVTVTPQMDEQLRSLITTV